MGDLLTRVTIWLALGLFAAAQIARRRRAATAGGAGVWLLACGWGLYVGHVLLAFGVHYDWSHTLAYAKTAAQIETAAVEIRTLVADFQQMDPVGHAAGKIAWYAMWVIVVFFCALLGYRVAAKRLIGKQTTTED